MRSGGLVAANENTDFLIKEVVWRFFCGEYFYMSGMAKLFFAFNNEEPNRSWL
jgi:hypothetical protein